MHYDDTWEKLHKNKIEKEEEANQLRRKIVMSSSWRDMIRIMFIDYISKLDDNEIIKLAKREL